MCISYVRQYPKRIAAMLLASVLLLAGGTYGMYHLKKDSADGRLLMWKVSTQIIREQQGLGVGVGHFPEAFAEAQASYLKHASSQEKWVAGCPEYAFNEYLQIAVELGIFPLLLFLMVGGCNGINDLTLVFLRYVLIYFRPSAVVPYIMRIEIAYINISQTSKT